MFLNFLSISNSIFYISPHTQTSQQRSSGNTEMLNTTFSGLVTEHSKEATRRRWEALRKVMQQQALEPSHRFTWLLKHWTDLRAFSI